MSEFVLTLAADAVQPEQMTKVMMDGRSVVFTRWQGQVYAFAGRCPHAAADLSEGETYRGKVECPTHGYQFDVTNGRVLWPRDEFCRLKTYPTQEKENQIWVKLE